MTAGPLSKQAERIGPYSTVIALSGIALCGIALLLPKPVFGLIAFSSGAALLWAVVLIWFLNFRQCRSRKRLNLAMATFVANDAAPSFATDMAGVIGYQNRAAVERFGGRGGQSVLSALEDIFAAPGATLSRMQSRALAKGAAREDVVMRHGHMRLAVHLVGENGFLWRLEDMAERGALAGDAISLPMLTLSPNNTVLFMNEAMHRLIGHREQSLDRMVTDLPIRPGDVHVLAGVEGSIYARVAQVENTRTGRKELFFIPDSTPNVGAWDALDALPVALLKVAVDGQIIESNRHARELLAIATHELFSLSDLVEGLGRPVQDWVSDVAMGRVRKPEFVRASRPQSDTFLQITLNRVEGPGDDIELIAVLSDATELKSLEAQFVQSQKMQAIGQLAGGVAHDFNNLLTAISGHCDLLLLRHDKSDADYGDLVQIHQNANRAASLVGQLLAFSRKQTLKPEVIDLRDTLSDLTHLLNRLVGEKVTLSLDHDIGLLPIRVDKRQLEQVLMNLVVNARDAMPDGGAIKIETRNEVLREAFTRDRATLPAGEYVVVSVTDQGNGIPPDRLQKVFEPFYTNKRTGEGTGLGLSTVYGIIKQTGGFIFVDSVVGTGTAFTIYLPAHTARAEAVVEASHKSFAEAGVAAERGSGVILLVEDEAPVRAFASRALRLRGYTVIEAENAEEALETLEDESLQIDVFVSDVIMPGMDGPSWVSQALKSRPGVKVVFVSGYAEDHFTDQQSRIPNSVFLPKPFSLSELTATVQSQFY